MKAELRIRIRLRLGFRLHGEREIHDQRGDSPRRIRVAAATGSVICDRLSEGELMIRRVIASAVSLPSPNSVPSRSPFANMETDLSLWRSWRKHQLADGVENDLKLGVVFVFKRGKLAGKFRIREEHLAQAHKCAHDRNVDLYGPRTPQDAGKHRDALRTA